jgi:hypothetical protein
MYATTGLPGRGCANTTPSWPRRPIAVRLTGMLCGSNGSISTTQPNMFGSLR